MEEWENRKIPFLMCKEYVFTAQLQAIGVLRMDFERMTLEQLKDWLISQSKINASLMTPLQQKESRECIAELNKRGYSVRQEGDVLVFRQVKK